MLHLAVGFADFGVGELVFGVVTEVLGFAVGQFAVDEVAEGVVGVVDAVVFAQAVAGDFVSVCLGAEAT